MPAAGYIVRKYGRTTISLVPSMHCQVFQEGKDCGDEAARWLDALIGKSGHRLVFRDPSITYRRTVINSTKKYTPWTKVAREEDEVRMATTLSIY